MAARGIPGCESTHRQAFAHYLRTGQRLTNAEWLNRQERKFNPYHDEIGRFTSPPGVTVSWGKRGGPKDRSPPTDRTQASRERADSTPNPPRGAPVQTGKAPSSNRASAPDRSSSVPNGAVSATIRKTWAPEAPVVSHFDLRKRQAHLDDLRQKAGPNASATDKAAFEETQRRLDAARERLAAGDRAADHEISEFSRVGLAPLDTFMSGASLFSGEGDLGDALNVASSVPIVGVAGKFGKFVLPGRVVADAAGPAVKIIQRGGAFKRLKTIPGYERHHIPGRAVSPLSDGDGPAISMTYADHRSLVSSFKSKAGDAFRNDQKELIARGDFEGAMMMDIKHIRDKFGNRYDDAISQMLKYSRDRGLIK